MMTDMIAARIRAHQANIRRYSRLLATQLTDLERQYIHRRIAEERRELEQLQAETQGDCRPPSFFSPKANSEQMAAALGA